MVAAATTALARVAEGQPGALDYKRRLSEAEQAVVDSERAAEQALEAVFQQRRRDYYFGFAGGTPEAGLFSPREAETCETSAAAPPADAP